MEASDRTACDELVCGYLSRLLGTPVTADHPHFAAASSRLDEVLAYHRRQFAEAGRGAETRWVLQQLRTGRLPYKTHPDCDLLEDVFLALLMEVGENAAFEAFQRRFARSVEQWARRYAWGDPSWGDALLGSLFEQRARSGSRISRYAGWGPLDSWVAQVARKLAPGARARPRVNLIQPDDAAGGLDGLGGRPVAHSSSDAAETEFDRWNCRELLAPAFRGCFDVLDAEQRVVLLQSIVDGVEQRQIARQLGVPAYQVTRTKQRAIARVRRRFHELAAELVDGGQETVRTCLELLRERFSDVPLDLKVIARGENTRNSAPCDGP